MKITVWNNGRFFDIGADVDMYNLMLFKRPPENLIDRETLTIGDFTFEPGKEYQKIGYANKSSSGYTYYWGDPLTYEGTIQGYLVFTTPQVKGWSDRGYVAIRFCFKITEGDVLFTLNHAGAGRLIEMTKKEKYGAKSSSADSDSTATLNSEGS